MTHRISNSARRNRIRNPRRAAVRHIGRALVFAAGLESMSWADRAAGVTHTWTGGGSFIGGGPWNVATAWSPSGVPGSGDAAILPGTSSTLDTTVTYDYTGSAVTLSFLRVSQGNWVFVHSSILSISA